MFEVFDATDSDWAAFGRGPGVDISVDSRQVPLGDIKLVRAIGPPAPALRPGISPPVTRGFPQDLVELPSESIPPPRAVELVLRNGQLSGSVAGESLSVEVPRLKWESPTSLSGSVADQAFSCQWTMSHQPAPTGSESYSAHLEGQHGREPLWLEAELHFRDGHSFDHATVTGILAGEAVEARIEPANGGLSGSDSFAVDGSQGTATFTVYISVNHIPNRAIIRGHVSDNAIHVDATLTHAGGRHIALAGSHQGPLLLLLLVVGAIAQFLR